jgi:hypothetical protein
MAQGTLISRTKLTGHAKRAQERLQKAVRGSSREDVLIQAGLGAVAAMVVLRLLRFSTARRLAASVAPMVAFAAIFSRAGRRERL